MEKIEKSEFMLCVDQIVAKEREAEKSICDFYRRFGIDVPKQRDETKLMSVTERLGLK